MQVCFAQNRNLPEGLCPEQIKKVLNEVIFVSEMILSSEILLTLRDVQHGVLQYGIQKGFILEVPVVFP